MTSSKKWGAAALAGLMSLSVAACSGTHDAPAPESSSSDIPNVVPSVTPSPSETDPFATPTTPAPSTVPTQSATASPDSSQSQDDAEGDGSATTGADSRTDSADHGKTDTKAPAASQKHDTPRSSHKGGASHTRTHSSHKGGGVAAHRAPQHESGHRASGHVSTPRRGSAIHHTNAHTVSASTAVRLRAKATTHSAVLDVLYPGDRATVVKGSVDGWTKVTFHGQTGYVASQYLNGAHTTAGKPKPAQSSKQVRTVIDKHRTITRNDPTLDWGTTKVETKGVDGRIRITYRNGREVSRQIVVKRVDEVILHGTKDVITTKTVDVPFKTITKDDPNLDWGTSRVETKGVAGKARVTYKNSKEIKRETITEPVTQIVYKGSRPVITTKDVPIDYKTVKRNDPTLDHGKTKVETKGVKGVARVTYRNGKEIKRETIKEPVTEVIRVGTKDVVTTKEVKVPFKTITKKDPNLPKGQTKVLTEGREGVVRITYKNGREVKREVITKPVNKVVAVGTKKKDVITTKEVKVPFKTVKKNDPNLPEGKTKVVQQGREGVDRVTYKNGREVKREHISKPVNKIIHVGTKKKPKPSKKPHVKITECGTPNADNPEWVNVYGEVHGPADMWIDSTVHVSGETEWGAPWSHDIHNGVAQLSSFGDYGFQHWAPKEIKNLKCSADVWVVNK